MTRKFRVGGFMWQGGRVRSHLRQFGVALLQGAVILIAMSALYIIGHLAVYQTFPRWK